ncbi:MCP four helix bundle domain-containing protein, partial [Thermodesulfovibrio yellowstonii]|uniref:MCP four helix bundle domain-containing protein n=1 Tax=Thermodesulfovibrio yellowstonii TaxID=28262 RepID=UPI0024B3965B
MFKNLTIGKKLMVGFGIVIFLLVILSAYTLYSIISTDTKVHDLEERFDKLLYAAEIQREVNAIHLKARKMFLINDISKKQEIMKEIEEHRKYYRKRMEELEKITRRQEGKQKLQNLINASNETRDANNKAIQLALAGKNQEAIELYLKEVESKAGNREKALNELVNYYHKTVTQRTVDINQSFNYELIISIILSVISIAIGIFFALFISRSVKKPVT